LALGRFRQVQDSGRDAGASSGPAARREREHAHDSAATIAGKSAAQAVANNATVTKQQ